MGYDRGKYKTYNHWHQSSSEKRVETCRPGVGVGADIYMACSCETQDTNQSSIIHRFALTKYLPGRILYQYFLLFVSLEAIENLEAHSPSLMSVENSNEMKCRELGQPVS